MPDSTCRWPECDSSKLKGHGLCNKHYLRAHRMGNLVSPWIDHAARINTPKPSCRWPGCDSADVTARGFCQRDYMRARRIGNFESPWDEFVGSPEWPDICRWPGCERDSLYLGFCDRDGQRAKSVGYVESPWIEWDALHPEKPTHCIWPGCTRKISGRNLCGRDYQRALAVDDFESPWTHWNADATCERCGSKVSRSKRYRGRFCSHICGVKQWRTDNPEKKLSYGLARRARERGLIAEKFTSVDLRRRDGDTCYLCGKGIDFTLRFPHTASPSMDHVIPLIKGGHHVITNAAMTHLGCNTRKSTKSLDEIGVEMPRFTKGDLTIETANRREAAELRRDGFTEQKARTKEVRAADAEQAKPTSTTK